jgi:hypothetical protein
MRFLSPIQLHPSCDPIDLLPMLAVPKAVHARSHAEGFFGHGHIAQGDGSDRGAAAVHWTLSDGCYKGILPTPLDEDGSRMRDTLMLHLNATEIAAR